MPRVLFYQDQCQSSALSPDHMPALRPDQRLALQSEQPAPREKEPNNQKWLGEHQSRDEPCHEAQNYPKKFKIQVGGGNVRSLISLWSSENSDDVSKTKFQNFGAAKLQPITSHFRTPAEPSTFVTKSRTSVIGQGDKKIWKATNGMKPTSDQI